MHWNSGYVGSRLGVIRRYRKLAPHDLRRARLCHLAGGELDQIQILARTRFDQTTGRYLAANKKLREAVNDRLGIEPDRDG